MEKIWMSRWRWIVVKPIWAFIVAKGVTKRIRTIEPIFCQRNNIVICKVFQRGMKSWVSSFFDKTFHYERISLLCIRACFRSWVKLKMHHLGGWKWRVLQCASASQQSTWVQTLLSESRLTNSAYTATARVLWIECFFLCGEAGVCRSEVRIGPISWWGEHLIYI